MKLLCLILALWSCTTLYAQTDAITSASAQATNRHSQRPRTRQRAERPQIRNNRRTIIAPPSQTATYDTDSSHINAHGGCIIRYGDQWLWYGEARPWRGFTSQGVSLYTATIDNQPSTIDHLSALQWENRGIVLSVTDSAGSPIERGCIIERPKVVWNERDQQFVMLFHLELKDQGYAAAMTGFATSKTPEGPFVFHHAQRPNAGLWPADFTSADIAKAQSLKESDYKESWTAEWRQAVADGLFLSRDFEKGQMSRDMTVFIDDDGTPWHIYSSEENLTLQAAELTPDYLGYTGRYYRIAAGGQNEAPVIFKHNGRYWLICSGCTGWEPNEARMFSAPAVQGPWTQYSSPMRGEGAEKTFSAQGTWAWNAGSESAPQLFFMADIWNPRSLAQSRHLCLPVSFSNNGIPVIFNVSSHPRN